MITDALYVCESFSHSHPVACMQEISAASKRTALAAEQLGKLHTCVLQQVGRLRLLPTSLAAACNTIERQRLAEVRHSTIAAAQAVAVLKSQHNSLTAARGSDVYAACIAGV